MIKYEVGQRFPNEKYLDRGEITVALINEKFFDVIVCISGITSKEAKGFRKGSFEISLFEKHNIPFVIFDFGEGFSFDVSLDIHKLTDEQTDKWLNEQGNVLNMFLIDATTGNLAAMRMVGVSSSLEGSIRDICELQSEMRAEEVEQKLNGILSVVSTKEMIKQRKMKQIFK